MSWDNYEVSSVRMAQRGIAIGPPKVKLMGGREDPWIPLDVNEETPRPDPKAVSDHSSWVQPAGVWPAQRGFLAVSVSKADFKILRDYAPLSMRQFAFSERGIIHIAYAHHKRLEIWRRLAAIGLLDSVETVCKSGSDVITAASEERLFGAWRLMGLARQITSIRADDLAVRSMEAWGSLTQLSMMLQSFERVRCLSRTTRGGDRQFPVLEATSANGSWQAGFSK